MTESQSAKYEPYKALYLHIPFCVSKCAYCDFESSACNANDAVIDEYVDQLILDIRKASREGILGQLQTVYIGGGTPSHLGMARLSKLLYTLSLSMHLTPEVECTMEANPESLDERMVRDIWALGVNRLSLGIQSFDDDVLRLLGRPHSSKAAIRAIEAIRTRFDNFSIDLMCGIPGQTTEIFAQSVQTAIDCKVPHISVYPLTIEEGTPFDSMVEQGLLDEPDDDIAAEHMQTAEALLVRAGYRRYEVASYAKPGHESRHNTAYWTGLPYLGLGKGATSMRQTASARERVVEGEVIETLDALEMLAEDLMLSMRMSRGISTESVDEASLVFEELPDLMNELIEQGLVRYEDKRFKPTKTGWLCGNELYGRFYDLGSA